MRVGMVLRERAERLVSDGNASMKECAIVPATCEPERARRLHVRRRGEPDDRAARATAIAASRPVRAPEREVHQVRRPARQPVARGLRRERRVQRHLVQQLRLHQLRGGDRRGDLQDRLARVHDPALRAPPTPRRRTARRGTPRCLVRRTRSSAGRRGRPRRTRTTRGSPGTPRARPRRGTRAPAAGCGRTG